jgi:chemotaxis signal transduction protein
MWARPLAFYADTVQGLLTCEEAGTTGLVTVHGVPYEPVDLADRLGLSSEKDGSDTRIVLISHGGLQGSIRVAQAHGLMELEQSQVLPLPRQFQGEEQNWYRGVILFEEGVALVLNPAWVLQGAGADQGGACQEWQGRAPRLLTVRPELVMGKVQEC